MSRIPSSPSKWINPLDRPGPSKSSATQALPPKPLSESRPPEWMGRHDGYVDKRRSRSPPHKSLRPWEDERERPAYRNGTPRSSERDRYRDRSYDNYGGRARGEYAPKSSKYDDHLSDWEKNRAVDRKEEPLRTKRKHEDRDERYEEKKSGRYEDRGRYGDIGRKEDRRDRGREQGEFRERSRSRDRERTRTSSGRYRDSSPKKSDEDYHKRRRRSHSRSRTRSRSRSRDRERNRERTRTYSSRRRTPTPDEEEGEIADEGTNTSRMPNESIEGRVVSGSENGSYQPIKIKNRPTKRISDNNVLDPPIRPMSPPPPPPPMEEGEVRPSTPEIPPPPPPVDRPPTPPAILTPPPPTERPPTPPPNDDRRPIVPGASSSYQPRAIHKVLDATKAEGKYDAQGERADGQASVPHAPNRNLLNPTTRPSTPSAKTEVAIAQESGLKLFTRPTAEDELRNLNKSFVGTTTLAAYDLGDKLGEGTFGYVSTVLSGMMKLTSVSSQKV